MTDAVPSGSTAKRLLRISIIALTVAAPLTVTAIGRQVDQAPPPATQPTEPGRGAVPPPQPTAEDVLRALQRTSGPRRPIIPPSPPREILRQPPVEVHPGTATPVQTRPRLLPEGYRLVERPGRLVKAADGHWTFVFEDRGEGPPEAPMKLLPNLILQQMESMTDGGTQPVVFLASGDVTEYHGENFLLVQKLFVRPNLGNLK